MRLALALTLLAALAAADEAERYFELGLGYLRKGMYERSAAAFAESLVRAPGEPVPLAFLGLAVAAAGRPPSEAALILRTGYLHLGDRQTIRLDLRLRLPSAKALAMLHRDLTLCLRSTRGRLRRDILGLLAFLEVHDGSPLRAPALDTLLKENRASSVYGAQLRRVQRSAPKRAEPQALSRRGARSPCSSPTTPPISSAPPGASWSSWWDRTRRRPARRGPPW